MTTIVNNNNAGPMVIDSSDKRLKRLHAIDVKLDGAVRRKIVQNQDGETDDGICMAVVAPASKNHEVKVFCSIGNPSFVHAFEDKSKEMEARVNFANDMFQGKVAHKGSSKKEEVCEAFIKEITEADGALVVETSAATNIYELAKRAQTGQLKNVTIIFYASVNLTWWAQAESGKEIPPEETYGKFYKAIENSGATLIQADAFPFLDTKNRINPECTPARSLF